MNPLGFLIVLAGIPVYFVWSRLSAARSRVDALLERLPDLNTPA